MPKHQFAIFGPLCRCGFAVSDVQRSAVGNAFVERRSQRLASHPVAPAGCCCLQVGGFSAMFRIEIDRQWRMSAACCSSVVPASGPLLLPAPRPVIPMVYLLQGVVSHLLIVAAVRFRSRFCSYETLAEAVWSYPRRHGNLQGLFRLLEFGDASPPWASLIAAQVAAAARYGFYNGDHRCQPVRGPGGWSILAGRSARHPVDSNSGSVRRRLLKQSISERRH